MCQYRIERMENVDKQLKQISCLVLGHVLILLSKLSCLCGLFMMYDLLIHYANHASTNLQEYSMIFKQNTNILCA